MLDIREENNFSDIELFKLLDKKRKSIHPERTTDEVVKKEYEEKFKKCNDLYKKLGEYLKSENNNNSVQLYNNEIEFDYVNIKLENDQLKKTISDLENKISILESQIKKKETTIEKLNDTKIKEETDKLKEYFKPKKTNLIILGVTALIGILLHVLSQTEQAIAIYLKYLPKSSPEIINLVTFFILIIITIIFFTSFIKKYLVQRWTAKIKSTDFNIKLFDYVKEQKEPKKDNDYDYIFSTKNYKFKERVIYSFIDESFKPRSKFSKILRKIIGLNEFAIYENFKNILIYGLINKEIIEISGNSGFDKILKYEE